MVELVSLDVCTGCTSCINSCSHHAIKMQVDKEGFMYPVIDKDICVECGLCVKRCPVLVPIQRDNKKNPIAFAAWSFNDRTISSSGGAFSAFARKTLKEHGIVWGSRWNDNLECKAQKAENVDELAALRGSKYVQSDLGKTFSEIKETLKNGRHVLFCGTPCQVAGLYAYLHKDYPNLLTLDLACHGVPSNSVFQAYLSRLKRKYNEDIDNFEFRRRNGWGFAPSVTIRGKLRPIYGLDNLYMQAFDKSALFRRSCYTCPYAKLPRVGDCSIADFWGIGRHGKPFKQNVLKGVSLILVNNGKGERAVAQLQDVFLEQRSLEEALIENHNITHPSKAHPQRNEIIQAFLNPFMSLNDIDSKFKLLDKSLKGRIKELASKWHVFNAVKSVYNVYKSI